MYARNLIPLVCTLGCVPEANFARNEQPHGERPNVIMILVDDMGYGDFGCYGNDYILTPNIDRMAAHGIRFTDFHANSAVSTPTRAALITGRYQQRCGLQNVLLENIPHHKNMGLPADEVTFAEVFKQAGYTTACIGKWHLGEAPESHPMRQGFDEFIGYMTNPDYVSHCGWTGVHDWMHGFEHSDEEGYITELITKYSVDFIERNSETPFCLYIGHKTAHDPYQGPSDPAIWKRDVKCEPLVLAARPGEERQVYKEMVESLDRGIGELLAALERRGIDKKTFIVFMSDNGHYRHGSSGGLRGFKSHLFEGGHRIPAIVYQPGVIPHRECSQTIIGMDIFPTLLQVAGVDYTPATGREFDGVSFYDVLFGGKMPQRTLFWRMGNGMAVREGKWKLVNQAGPDNPRREYMLFDLHNDLGETMNLAAQRPAVVSKLKAKFEEWEKRVDSSVPAMNKNW